MRLIFIRHGETDWNVQKKIQGCTNIALNELGMQQAGSLGWQLEHENLHATRIYTSKLDRARKTAEIIGEILHIPDSLDNEQKFFLKLLGGSFSTWALKAAQIARDVVFLATLPRK